MIYNKTIIDMKPLKKQLKLDNKEFYDTHMSIVNALLPVKMTPKEVEIVAAFLSITGTLAEDRFSTTGRQVVRKLLGISHQYLTNYIKSLIKKGFIQENNNKLELIPILFPERKEQNYIIKLVNIDNV